MNEILIPAKEVRNETWAENSRFITSLAPVFSVEEARSFIAKIRAEFPDASHHVPVFIIGHGTTMISHSTDDREPQGTAGRPALAVLQGSGMGDVAVVVTRYFGGTKLGKGGLVRAYGDAVRAILKITPRAKKAATYSVMMVIPYALYEQIRLLIQAYQGKIIDESFMAEVTITCQLLIEHYRPFNQELLEITKGEQVAEIIETNLATILPIER
jgi:uncharacterized YigZ family protein